MPLTTNPLLERSMATESIRELWKGLYRQKKRKGRVKVYLGVDKHRDAGEALVEIGRSYNVSHSTISRL
jgi:hypothetical protein